MKRRTWMALGVLAIAAAGLVSARSDPPQWSEAKVWADQRRAAWQGDGCPVVGEEVVEGCSRDDYRVATELAGRWPRELQERVLRTRDREGGSPEVGAAVMAEVVAALRRGARRARDVAPDLERFGPGAERSMFEAGSLWTALATLTATLRDPAVDPLELLPDALVVLGDLAASGIGIERLSAEVELRRLVDAVTDDLLRGGAEQRLARVATAAETVAEALPAGSDFVERDLVYWIRCTADPDAMAANAALVPWWWTWRDGFSRRAYVVEAVCEPWQLVHECNAVAPGTDWPARRARLERIQEQLRGRAKRATVFGLPDVVTLEEQVRATRAALRQLQMAVAFHRGLPVPSLPDPLGAAAMRCEIDGATATFTSADRSVRRVATRSR